LGESGGGGAMENQNPSLILPRMWDFVRRANQRDCPEQVRWQPVGRNFFCSQNFLPVLVWWADNVKKGEHHSGRGHHQ
jgi:hypothetical protein